MPLERNTSNREAGAGWFKIDFSIGRGLHGGYQVGAGVHGGDNSAAGGADFNACRRTSSTLSKTPLFIRSWMRASSSGLRISMVIAAAPSCSRIPNMGAFCHEASSGVATVTAFVTTGFSFDNESMVNSKDELAEGWRRPVFQGLRLYRSFESRRGICRA